MSDSDGQSVLHPVQFPDAAPDETDMAIGPASSGLSGVSSSRCVVMTDSSNARAVRSDVTVPPHAAVPARCQGRQRAAPVCAVADRGTA